jgi:1A family penicillin-binding protein
MLLKLLLLVGRMLSALGQPPLLVIKIILRASFWALREVKRLQKRARKKIKAFKFPKLVLPKITLPRLSLPKIVLPQKLTYLFIGAAATFFFVFVPYWVSSELDQLPNPKLLAARDIPVSTKIYDRNGTLLYEIYADENRSLVNLSQLPKYVVDATIAIEDKNFYRHAGVDLQGIARAAVANASGETVQGGSTITQQLIKSALLTPERTWQRKIREVILSFWAERLYSKEEILRMYLNQIPYGGAAYGIEAAAETYFAKPAQNLTLGEAAYLAGLISAPTTYSPFGLHPELARGRQEQVLAAMVNQGLVQPTQATAALAEPVKLATTLTEIKAPHFVMYVRDYLTKKYGIRTVEQGGLDVITSLDYPTYEMTLKAVKDGVTAQKNLNVGNGAALVTNPKTGEILAMVGSTDFFDLANDGNVNVTLAARSPGSSIKPLNYALAFEKNLITPSTIIDDSPVNYKGYSPKNYDNRFHGRVTVRTALASSYNIPAVKILDKNGVGNFIDFAKKLGITTFDDPSRFGLALTLGGGEVTMTDMATAYSAFANEGVKTNLNPILKITDYRGKVLEENNVEGEKVMSSQTAFLISNILADNSARTPAFGPASALVIPGHTVSVKTGTTQDKRDNWTIGYTPSVLAAVWVGNNDNSPMSPYLESGNTGAAAIWHPIMVSLLQDQPDQEATRPDEIVPVRVCTLNGLLPCENCPSVRTEYFRRGTEPKSACKFTKEEVEKILHPEPQNNQ